MIEAGFRLIRDIESGGWPVKSAFWYFEEEENRWRLCISSEEVEMKGPRNAYKRLSELLSSRQYSPLNLEDISVLPPGHKLVNLIRAAIRTGAGLAQIRFSRNTINGHFI
jgi:hypothetical protein